MIAWLKKTFGLGSTKPAPARHVTLSTLAPGDVVMHLDTSFIVEQRITYYQQGFFWFDYRLDDGEGHVAWLSVCDDDDLELAFFFPADLPVEFPPPKEISFDGTTFRLDEQGTVDAKIDRGSGSETRTTVQTWDYEGDDDRLLGIQLWGEGEVEVMIGSPIQPVELDLLGGADA